MKIYKFFIAFILCFMAFAKVANSQESSLDKFKKLQWLLGKWQRTNSKPGQSGQENWYKVSESKLLGKGLTLKGKQTVFVEELELSIQGKEIFYIVKLSDEPKPVYFKLTGISNDGFVCENPEHDFPKKIAYNKKGKKVKAVVSGNGQSIVYDFIPFKA